MIRYNRDINFDNHLANMVKIDGYEMVRDLHFLHTVKDEELPQEINRKWHPEIETIYKNRLVGNDPFFEVKKTWIKERETNFYIYERDPIDDWTGYDWLFLEDLLVDIKWVNLLNHTFTLLKRYSNWEGDIRQGPFIAMFPGDECEFNSFVVLLKQDNNGNTYVVSRHPLENLNDCLIKSHIMR